MRTRLFSLLIAALCLTPVIMVACGDDSGDGDMAMGPDLSAGGMDTCLQIVTCAQSCTAAACVQACVAKGSTKAQGAFSALSTCAFGQCTVAKDGGAAACMSATDFAAGCVTCVTAAGQSAACGTQLQACLTS